MEFVNANSFFYKGVIFHHIGNYQGAIENYHWYIDLKPNDDKGYGWLSFSLRILGKYQDFYIPNS